MEKDKKEEKIKIKNPRIFLYGAGSEWGMGHLSMNCAYARGIKKVMPESDVLIVSGAKLTNYLVKLIPENVEFIKLPLLRATELKEYPLSSEKLKIPVEDIFSIRKDILYRVFLRFRPHVIIVNHAASGIGGEELKPILKMIHNQRKQKKAQFPIRIYCPLPITDFSHSMETKVRGKRDIDRKRREALSLLDNNYDYIFFGVPPSIFWCDHVALPKKSLPGSIMKKMFFHGYFTNYDEEEFLKDTQIKRKIRLKNKEKLIVVSCGGGRDGFEILSLYLKVHPFIKTSLKTVLFPGPYMPEEEVKRLQRTIQGKKNLYIETFKGGTDFRLADWMNAADLFIGMAGYATLAEVLTTRVRAILIPRHPNIEGEQFIHCSILKEKKLVEMLDPRKVNKEIFLKAIQKNLHMRRLDTEKTKSLVNGSLKAAKRIKALIEAKLKIR